MEIIELKNGQMSNNYLVINKDKALLIDCSASVQTVKNKLGNRELVGIIITHGHFDHFISLKEMLDCFNCKVYMHNKVAGKLGDAKLNASGYFDNLVQLDIDKNMIKFVKDEDDFNIADFNVKIYEALGHTADSILIKIENHIFTGDFVFENGYGRTDLETGSFDEFKKYYRKHLKMLNENLLHYGH